MLKFAEQLFDEERIPVVHTDWYTGERFNCYLDELELYGTCECGECIPQCEIGVYNTSRLCNSCAFRKHTKRTVDFGKAYVVEPSKEDVPWTDGLCAVCGEQEEDDFVLVTTHECRSERVFNDT